MASYNETTILMGGQPPRSEGSQLKAAAIGAMTGLAMVLAYSSMQASSPTALFSTAAVAKPVLVTGTAAHPGFAPSQPLTVPRAFHTPTGDSADQAVQYGRPVGHSEISAAPVAPTLSWVSVGLASALAFVVGMCFGKGRAQQLPAPAHQTVQQIAMAAYTSEHDYDYDLVVIGAGSGGVRAARISAGHGARVALLEPSMAHGPPLYSAVGGTCVNVGCVPKKLMVYGAEYSHALKDAQSYGWAVPEGIDHDWTKLMANKDKEISRLNGIYKNMLTNSGVELTTGWGSLVDAHTVAVRKDRFSEEPDSTITAEKILIAVGGWPFIPDIPGKELCITSNEAFYLKECPKRVVVVGGGYIAVEFSCIFNGYGAEVTQMYRGDMFLRGFDDDMREHLAGEMQQQGINTMFNTNPAKVEKQDDGSLLVTTEAGEVVPCDVVMFATGRRPNIRALGLDTVGVEVRDRDGAIVVDEYSKTTVDSIYCVGDATNRINLTPVALHEGHCFADTEYAGMDRKPDHENVAAAVFSNPPLGTVGLTEAEAGAKFEKVAVYKSGFRPMVHTMTDSTTRVLMKLLVDVATNKVVGVHMCGPEAAEILQGLAIAVKMGATKQDFDSTIGIHPSAAEEFVTMRSASYYLLNGEKVDSL